MKYTLILYFALLTIISDSETVINCKIETSQGSIFVELYPDKAPNTVSNFLKYISKGLYDNSSFFRVCTPENEADRDIKIEVIQGGDVSEESLLPPISLETTLQTGILHKNGTISMARDTPDSAQSSFFICINDQPELDYKGKRNPDEQGFAAFGKVIQGMDIVLKIQALKNKGQYLEKPVTIHSIIIIK